MTHGPGSWGNGTPGQPPGDWGRSGDPDSEITLPNIFAGGRGDDDPDAIVENLTARITGTAPEPESALDGTPVGAQQAVAGGWQDPTLYQGPEQVSPGPVAGSGAVDPFVEADRRRRRRAMFSVLGVVGATVLVVAAALLIAPHFSDSSNTDPTPTPTLGVSTPSSTPAVTTATNAPPSGTTASSVSVLPPSTPSAPSTTVVTRTATVAPPASGTPSVASSTRATPSSSAISSSSAPSTAASSSAAPPLGVPQQNIACSDGYIVQLASELTPEAFAARVTALKSQGMVPADAKVADSRASCAIFTNQRNTYVLYAGPFASYAGGCADRIAGPSDAFIKGANPDTAHEFFSCVCPARVGALPQLSSGSGQHGWIGELQRMLAGRLNISVGELGADQWGVYTDGTRDAVKRFQHDAKLPATGVVNARTWKALQREGC